MTSSGRGSQFLAHLCSQCAQLVTNLLKKYFIGSLAIFLVFTLSHNASAQAIVTVAPVSLSFGNHYVGIMTGSKVVTLTNKQSAPLKISSIAVSGGTAPADYTLGNLCPLSKTLAAGQSCIINVRFQASALGNRTGTLKITDTASSSPQMVALSGTGTAVVSLAPASMVFDDQNVGTKSAAKTLSLTNNMTTTLSFTSISASGDFAVASNTCGSSIAAGAKCSIAVTFTPAATGTRTGTLSICESGVNIPSVVPLSGNGEDDQTWGKIQHVIILFQENRTPDNLFQDPVLISRGADIASSGINSAGQTIPLTPIGLGTKSTNPQFYDVNHSHNSFLLMYDGGKMDGADKIPLNCYTYTPPMCPPANAQFRYVQPSDVGPYFQLAEQYTFGDRMFQTNQGPSYPAHLFIISGTSAPTADSNSFMSENPGGGTLSSAAGCIAPPNVYAKVLDPFGATTTIYPCTEHPALTDLLNTKGISWRYYTPTAGSIWTGPNGIQHICGPNVAPPNATACTSPDWTSHVVVAADNNKPTVLQDIANGQLASVSWVIPNGADSDHAGNNYGTGPSWIASVVNAVGASPYWSNTAIIITWDDWGGWYDHVPPPQVINDGTSWGSGYVYGFRVPLIVVSPYAKPGYISHVTHDFGSILKFVEQVFELPSLGYADARADDLSDCFNFNQTPSPYKTIAAPLNATHFLQRTAAPLDPDDD